MMKKSFKSKKKVTVLLAFMMATIPFLFNQGKMMLMELVNLLMHYSVEILLERFIFFKS